MIVNITYDINVLCKKVLQEQLELLQVSYQQLGSTEVEIQDDISPDKLKQLEVGLNAYGCEIVENSKSVLVQKIKDTIIEMIHANEELPTSKISLYLQDKLKYRYGYMSNVFSEVTFSTIEYFIILQKTERAKQLIITTELNLSEIAWKLSYSSLGHFSSQFKNVTGLTPTAFKRIIEKRRDYKEQSIIL